MVCKAFNPAGLGHWVEPVLGVGAAVVRRPSVTGLAWSVGRRSGGNLPRGRVDRSVLAFLRVMYGWQAATNLSQAGHEATLHWRNPDCRWSRAATYCLIARFRHPIPRNPHRLDATAVQNVGQRVFR